MRKARRDQWLAVGSGMAALLLLVAALPAAGAKPEEKAAASKDTSQYVGSDTCKTCHEDIYKNFETTPHWKTTFNKKGPEWQGCEGCHGPGAEHVAAGGDKSKIFTFKDVSPKEVSKRCLECHQYGEEHANFDRSQHNINDVSCIACHSPHHSKDREFLLVQKQPDLCFTCHTETKQDFSRPFRHRVEQGLVRCTDCHNQHGGFLTKQLRATAAQDQVCFKCHADKAGPFAFEHEPVKTEGCVACHSPHGSTNPRLLKRSQINLLCLECHTLTVDSPVPEAPSFHNQAQKYQACTICHVAIHGSNFDHFFFR
ncbi:MAG: DmsE family decaheme c-type cytochrome [Acidobacteriia bacterium]|nr:DmsE family decaheme c-type cytochrome [Terriglobia bacterium]